MGRNLGQVHGGLLRWARSQQGLSMRKVQELGGPSPGYQSEIEQQRLADVSAPTLQRWIKALNVTESFVVGQVPVYQRDPQSCYGLAAEIADLVQSETYNGPDLAQMDPVSRTREVLRLVADRSANLPGVVLAYLLGVELQTLNLMLQGTVLIMAEHKNALAAITNLPESFFQHGTFTEDRIKAYHPAIRFAIKLGLSPEDVEDLIFSRVKLNSKRV